VGPTLRDVLRDDDDNQVNSVLYHHPSTIPYLATHARLDLALSDRFAAIVRNGTGCSGALGEDPCTTDSCTTTPDVTATRPWSRRRPIRRKVLPARANCRRRASKWMRRTCEKSQPGVAKHHRLAMDPRLDHPTVQSYQETVGATPRAGAAIPHGQTANSNWPDLNICLLPFIIHVCKQFSTCVNGKKSASHLSVLDPEAPLFGPIRAFIMPSALPSAGAVTRTDQHDGLVQHHASNAAAPRAVRSSIRRPRTCRNRRSALSSYGPSIRFIARLVAPSLVASMPKRATFPLSKPRGGNRPPRILDVHPQDDWTIDGASVEKP
jgi:hypothetical protein